MPAEEGGRASAPKELGTWEVMGSGIKNSNLDVVFPDL